MNKRKFLTYAAYCLLFLSLSLSQAFAVKVSIEDLQYHSEYKGRVKSVKEFEGNNVSISYYDESGRFQRQDRLSDGKQETVESMKYDKWGFPTEHNSGGAVTALKFNSQHQLQFIDDGIHVSEKQYTPKGLVYRTVMFKKNGEYDVMVEYAYDKNDNIIEQHHYKLTRNGWRKTAMVKNEFTGNNVLKTETWYVFERFDTVPKPKIWTKRTFNGAGLPIEDIRYGNSYKVAETTTYTYDEQGNLTKRLRSKGNSNETLTNTYTYDEQGNPTVVAYKCVVEKTEMADDESWGNYSGSRRYEYEYYPQTTTKKAEVKAAVNGYGPTGKYEQKGNWEQSFKILTKLAAKGNTEAMCRLAFYYQTGTATTANYQKAAELYRTAAEKGSAEAQYCLGFSYLLGSGVEKNKAEADKWLLSAAGKGHKKAYYDAGLCLQAKEERDHFSAKAVEYFRQSAAMGYLPAQKVLNIIEKHIKSAEKAKGKDDGKSSIR